MKLDIEMIKIFSSFTHLGFTMMTCILTGFFIGLGLDKFFHTKLIFLIIFTIIGVASAFSSMLSIATKQSKNDKKM